MQIHIEAHLILNMNTLQFLSLPRARFLHAHPVIPFRRPLPVSAEGESRTKTESLCH